MHLRAGKRRILANDTAKRFTDGRCFCCVGSNYRAAEYAARKKAQMFNVARAEVKGVGTGTGSKESGKD